MVDLNHLFGRRLPVLQAAEAAECGLVCMTMVARYFGHDVDLNALRRRFGMSMSGSTLRGLMQIADSLGFSTRAIRLEVSDLASLPTPAVLHWNLNHFVVLKSASRTRITVHDPARGERSYTMEEASKRFTGVALEIAPSAEFRPIVERTPMKLTSLWSRVRGFGAAFAQVLALSFALQVIALALPFQLQLVIDEGILSSDANLLVTIAAGFGLLMVIQFAVEALRSWSILVFGQTASFQIIGNVVRHLMRLPSDWFEKRHVGDVMSRIGSTTAIQEMLTRGVITVVIDGVMSLLLLTMMLVYSPTLTAVALAAMAINFCVTAALFPALRDRTAENLVRRAQEQSHLMESVRAATTIKIMGREAEREGSWRNIFAGTINTAVSVGKYEIFRTGLQALVTNLQFVLIVYIGARTILAGEGLSIGMLFAFISFQATFSERSNALINQFLQFRFLGVHLERLSDIVSADADAPAHRQIAVGGVRGGLGLQNVSFRYGTADRLVLKDVTLDVAPGEFLAITGPSGGGKSTILKLLLGLRQPISGKVMVDGEVQPADGWRGWREHVGVVTQDDRLLSGSIADNIAFFDPDPDQAKVERVARAAHIHDDIVRMPMQYMSLVGDMGSALSGGQRQRLLFARALYREPKVLILDEGTANLDLDTERLISDLIAGMPITRIVVAHRPALLERADRVVTLIDGCLTENGAHTDEAPDLRNLVPERTS